MQLGSQDSPDSREGRTPYGSDQIAPGQDRNGGANDWPLSDSRPGKCGDSTVAG